jgi:GNAT superfamily N-acetyltransferase
MNLRSALEQLPEAELTVAHFNALRTTPAPDVADIARGTTPSFAYLLDRTRPDSTYYNRAVPYSPQALSPVALADLPPGIVAIETKPADLTPASSAVLRARGFTPQFQLCYLACIPSGRQPLDWNVRCLGPTQVNEFFDLLQLQGVDFPPDKRAAKRQYYCTAHFQAYVATTTDGTVCGWTTLFIGAGYAFFGNAYTRPEFRRSGVHRALLTARLNAASKLGVAVAYTDVEHQSHSHYNCERTGFRTLTINTIWVRQG